MRDNDAMIKKRSIILTLSYILVVISIITLDQSTKWFFEKHYMLHSSHDSILKYNNDSKLIASLGNITSLKESWVRLDFTYVRNPGAAWGLLGAMNESFRKYFFSIVTVLAIFLIIYLFPPFSRGVGDCIDGGFSGVCCSIGGKVAVKEAAMEI